MLTHGCGRYSEKYEVYVYCEYKCSLCGVTTAICINKGCHWGDAAELIAATARHKQKLTNTTCPTCSGTKVMKSGKCTHNYTRAHWRCGHGEDKSANYHT